MDPQPISYYARALRDELPADAFAPVPSRLAWLALHVALAAAGMVAVAHGWGGTLGALAAALVIGHSFAGMAFVGHETLHGAVVRSPRWRNAVGWLCFAPFGISPGLWVAWHNRTHHGNTMKHGVDPDAFPTLGEFRARPLLRFADRLAFGARRASGAVMLCLGLLIQSIELLWVYPERVGLAGAELRRAQATALLQWAVWAALAYGVGGHAFVFAFVLPLLVGNVVVTSYILTNHSLSPMTNVNDPLLNSLSVTAPRWIEILHLDFGLHVEHHLFPAMSSHYAPAVRKLLIDHWPGRYQSLPLFRALALLFNTPRIYRDATTLVDPHTGKLYATLLPVEDAARLDRAA